MSTGSGTAQYTPFSCSTLELGKTYGELHFTVTRESHEKARSLLFASMEGKPSDAGLYAQVLLPSELWAMARVFSLSFGKLNEVGLARAVWRLAGTTAPFSGLTANAVVTAKIPRDRLAFCATRTNTYDSTGKLLMQAEDKILMVHDCVKPFFVEPARVLGSIPANLLYSNRHTVYFRYEWDPAVWTNNIHVDEYAQLCGFERGLPEFIIFMDWIYHAAMQSGWLTDDTFSISLHKILPMYRDELIDVIAYEEADCLQVRLLRSGAERIVAKVRKV